MWLVCEDKTSGELFIMSRGMREMLLDEFRLAGHLPNTRVLKDFDEHEQAVKYKIGIEQVNDKLKKIFEL